MLQAIVAENIPLNLIRIILAEENIMKKTRFFLGGKALSLFGLFFISISLNVSLYAQEADSVRLLDDVIIYDSRVDNTTPLTTSKLDRSQLSDSKTDASVPYIIELQPGVVSVGENGKMGNTSFRLRGIDATRINVNINGITLNDAESQTVFWVNIPNLSGMVQSMQIQRGVGASTGGSASFGGAVNMQTLNARNRAYADIDMSVGSWNTWQYGITAGTGIRPVGNKGGGLAFDVAYNGLQSDGYVRNGFCDHQSLFLTAGYYGVKSLFKAVIILGKQRTGITWDGASAEQLDDDPTFNPSGMYYNAFGELGYYQNESDNYNQQHYQLYYSLYLNDSWLWNSALDFTHGAGYYEQYKDDRSAAAYGMAGDIIDIVTRKQMSNNALTVNSTWRYCHTKWEVSFGGSLLHYDGDHFGNVIMQENVQTASLSHINHHEWYRNKGVKTDGSLFLKSEYRHNPYLNFYGDFQYRLVHYTIDGPDEDIFDGGEAMAFDQQYRFFNPKVGVNWIPSINNRLYFVAGIAHREPTRADIKDVLKTNDTIKAEALLDFEWGYQYQSSKLSFNVNAYSMLYKNQLTASGELSPSGYALMVNVDKSYRLGLEMEAGYRFSKWFDVSGNLTLSTNKILDYQYNDSVNLGTTNLSFSPSTVGAILLTFSPVGNLKLQLSGKYVGQMYADNTSREEMLQDDYFIMNFKASYKWSLGADGNKELESQFVVNNILNQRYRLSAWAADYGNGQIYRGYYQQPGINVVARIVLKF